VLLKQVISMNYCNALVLPAPSVHFRGPRAVSVYARTRILPGGEARPGGATARALSLSLSPWILRGSTCQALTRPDYTAEVSPAKDSTSGNERVGSPARPKEKRAKEKEKERDSVPRSRELRRAPCCDSIVSPA